MTHLLIAVGHRLHDERVRAAHRLLVPDEDLAVGELVRVRRRRRDAEHLRRSPRPAPGSPGRRRASGSCGSPRRCCPSARLLPWVEGWLFACSIPRRPASVPPAAAVPRRADWLTSPRRLRPRACAAAAADDRCPAACAPTQPSMLRCWRPRHAQRARRHVLGDHAAGRHVRARRPTSTGATSMVSQPTHAASPTVVWCLCHPVVVDEDRAPRRCWPARRSSRRPRRTGAAPSRPSPSSAFFVSTNVPTFALRASRVPGRRYAYGPDGRLRRRSRRRPRAPRTTGRPRPPSCRSAWCPARPRAPAPTAVAPRSCVFWSITASGAERHRHVDPGGRRVEDRHAGAHPGRR